MNYGNYPELSCVKKILIIKLRHHGDVLLTSPLFSTLKQHVPHASIDAFLYKDTLPMLEGHAAIDQFLLYDRSWKKEGFIKRASQELSLLSQIARSSYDLVINLTEGDRGAIASFISRAKYKVGMEGNRSGFFSEKRRYTHRVKTSPNPRHTVEKQLDFARRIGVFPTEEEKELFLHIPQQAQLSVQARLAQEGIEPHSYVLIHPASRWKFKCLSVEQMGEVMRLLSLAGLPLVFTSGPDAQEVKMVEEILRCNPSIPVLNLAGSLSLKELAAWIDSAKTVLCVDSLPLHISSATKTPVVALFGPTSEQNWGPWRHPQARILTRPFSCRPCFQDGCGGSKKSECLLSLSPKEIASAVTLDLPIAGVDYKYRSEYTCPAQLTHLHAVEPMPDRSRHTRFLGSVETQERR